MVRLIAITAGIACFSVSAGLVLAYGHGVMSGDSRLSTLQAASETDLPRLSDPILAAPEQIAPRLPETGKSLRTASREMFEIDRNRPQRGQTVPQVFNLDERGSAALRPVQTPDPAADPAVLALRPLSRPQDLTLAAAAPDSARTPLPDVLRPTAPQRVDTPYAVPPAQVSTQVTLPPQLTRRGSGTPSPSFFIGVFR